MQQKPDEKEYWTEVFEACRLGERGERLEDFLRDPWTVLCRHGQESAPECLANGFRPLLPRQVAVARKLAEMWANESGAVDAGAGDSGECRDPVRSTHGLMVPWHPFPTRRRRA